MDSSAGPVSKPKRIISKDYERNIRRREQRKQKKLEEEQKKQNINGVADDPPFRLSGHEYIGRQIQYQCNIRSKTKQGTITGFIDAADTDRDGEPGFTCSRTGVPANLY